ncbi:MAG: cysteine desulfurase [Ruminococcaceae bacterium]|nr:cysteine desulfurase [Oscillospiraceae bacterium]
MAEIYLDNSATTRVCRAAADKAYDMMMHTYGNPSSLHTLGFRAEQELTAARQTVAKLLGAQPEELYFTSGGTESNNLAVLGSVEAHARAGKHVVTTAVEHSSVAEACDRLEKQGYEITRLVPDADGTISAARMVAACRPDTVLVTVMLVNNETGARFPLEKAIPGIRRVAPRAHIHCDAVQAAGKMPLLADRWGLDSLSASAHKLHGPKGCGVLFLRRGCRVIPRQIGGKQEGGIRCGTEAAPLIAAFGVAAKELPSYPEQNAHYTMLRERLLEGLRRLPDVRLHLPAENVPHIVHLSVPGLRSETMLHFLAQREIYVSSGSACAKGAKSPVLTAMGLPAEEIDSALRISMDMSNTLEEMDLFVQALQEAIRVLARR